MTDLTQALRAFAAEKRVDLLGIAPIERFDDVAPEHHPSSIFPETRSVLVVGKRVPRGALRGLEEGTQFDLYGQYGRDWLTDRMLAMCTITVATWLEENGWEAVPLQDLPPETPPTGVPVAPDKPAPNVMIDVKAAAVRAGLGEIGWCGELLTPRFGPRQRCQLVLTDAELTPDAMLADPICDQCGECASQCPLGAMSGEQVMTVAGKSMTVAIIDRAACKACRNGATPNKYHAAGMPDRLGAVCARTCVDHLERAGLVENTFNHAFRQRPAWRIDRMGNTSLADGASE